MPCETESNQLLGITDTVALLLLLLLLLLLPLLLLPLLSSTGQTYCPI
jgi:hypothetical protein